MGANTAGETIYHYQWTSDVDFDGIRLEVLSPNGDVMFDSSIPDIGPLTLNTFSPDVPVELV